MICTVHQPNYLPYLGFFEKAYRSDVFILYDTTQFKKNDWQNRNKICTPKGWEWITVPVVHEFGLKIMETKINNPQNALTKNWRTIQTIYGRAPYFRMYSSILEEIYSTKYEKINELNCSLITTIAVFLGLKTKFVRSSELPAIESKSTQALIDLCKLVNADTYISGSEGINYIDMDLWNSSGLKLLFQKYEHPVYKQFNNPVFQSHMNVLDLLFNSGNESLGIMLKIR
ncbi:MAG TPA: WbqC family protein [Ignavibacteria bacterium]|jgi:hypothetical protein